MKIDFYEIARRAMAREQATYAARETTRAWLSKYAIGRHPRTDAGSAPCTMRAGETT